MGAQNLNRVLITGNLTRDPETRQFPSGGSVASMRVAVNGRRKNGDQWEDKANYFDVSAFGGLGDNCQRYLSKGSGVAIDGRLDWREWTDKEGNKRQSVEIVADNVQFLGDGGSSNQSSSQVPAQQQAEGYGFDAPSQPYASQYGGGDF